MIHANVLCLSTSISGIIEVLSGEKQCHVTCGLVTGKCLVILLDICKKSVKGMTENGTLSFVVVKIFILHIYTRGMELVYKFILSTHSYFLFVHNFFWDVCQTPLNMYMNATILPVQLWIYSV